jgi:hypothetical protein
MPATQRPRGQTLNAEILKRLDDSFEMKKLLDKLHDSIQSSSASLSFAVDHMKALEQHESQLVEKLAQQFNLPAGEI